MFASRFFARPVADGAFLLPLGTVNAVLLRGAGELALVDTGYPGNARRILKAIRALGHRAAELRHIVLTHAHVDHLGSAAALVRATGATTWIHERDAPIAETGGPYRPMRPAPGPFHHLLYRMVWDPNAPTEPVRIDRRFRDNDVLPVAGGLRAVHVPGHCAGQCALLWDGGRFLIAADAAINVLGLSDPPGFEDEAAGRRSQRRLAGLDFDAAVFGHGRAITSGAAARFRGKWG